MTSEGRAGTTPRRWLGLVALGTIAATVLGVGVMAVLPQLTCGCTPASQTPNIVSPVVGVVVRIDSAGLDQVRSFDLRIATGQVLTLRMGALENATEFPPGHLAEHQATSTPVRAFYREDASGAPVVYRLEDG